jgi:hypothetical protein
MLRENRTRCPRSIQPGAEREFEGQVVKDHEAAEMCYHLMDFYATLGVYRR